jgi:hypothetical protein
MRGRPGRLGIPFESGAPGEGANLSAEDDASWGLRRPSPGSRLLIPSLLLREGEEIIQEGRGAGEYPDRRRELIAMTLPDVICTVACHLPTVLEEARPVFVMRGGDSFRRNAGQHHGIVSAGGDTA